MQISIANEEAAMLREILEANLRATITESGPTKRAKKA